jgi:hypothetical protein
MAAPRRRSGNGANPPPQLGEPHDRSPPPNAEVQCHTFSEAWVRVICTLAPRRERGELGHGWVRAAQSAAWMPLTETGQSPGINSAETMDGVGA